VLALVGFAELVLGTVVALFYGLDKSHGIFLQMLLGCFVLAHVRRAKHLTLHPNDVLDIGV
jgi:hypothetical protein